MVDPLAPLDAPLDITELVREHHAALYRYALRLTGRIQDAEDLVQQAFLVAQQKLCQVRSADTVRAWLFTVLRNVYLKSRSKQQTAPLVGLEIDLSILVQQSAYEPIDQEALQQALADLPDEFRLVVLMFYFEDQSYKQIAESLDVPIGTVMSRLSRAKAHLRRRLSRGLEDTADQRPNEGCESVGHFDLKLSETVKLSETANVGPRR